MGKTNGDSETTLVATLTSPPSADGTELEQLPDGVGYLEVRADLVGNLDPDWLRDRFAGGLIYTLRSRSEGGAGDSGKSARRQRLAAGAERYDLVDLEAERDLSQDLLRTVPEERRLISWHGATAIPLAALKERCDAMTATPARFYKLIPVAKQDGDSLHPLILLHGLGRNDVVAFATGNSGAWTRMLAPFLGSPLIYGSFGDQPAAPGQLSIRRLIEDFGLPQLPAVDRLYGIVGRPVRHSLSPRLHNAAYRSLGLPALYLPFHAESYGDFWIDVVEAGMLELFGLPLRGLSVTAPYKDAALAVAGASSPRANHIEAANTLVWNEGVWEAESTDPEGVFRGLEAAGVDIEGMPAAVVGCGGAGKAGAYGLQIRGADVTLVNRSEERGRHAAAALDMPFVALADFDPSRYRIIVHATALGHHPDDDQPFDVAALSADTAVVDMVYGPPSAGRPSAGHAETRLIQEAKARGCRTVDGREVLFYQAVRQFRLMTGEQLDIDLGRRILGIGGDP